MENTGLTNNAGCIHVQQRGSEVFIILDHCKYSELEEHMEEISRYAVPDSTMIHFHTKTISMRATKTDDFSAEALESLLQRYFGKVNP